MDVARVAYCARARARDRRNSSHTALADRAAADRSMSAKTFVPATGPLINLLVLLALAASDEAPRWRTTMRAAFMIADAIWAKSQVIEVAGLLVLP
jgi:hypothetical protein